MEIKYTLTEEELKNIFACIEESTFVCSVCNKIMFPKIEFLEDEIRTTKETTDICGGLGNKTTKRNVCNDCANEMTLQSKIGD